MPEVDVKQVHEQNKKTGDIYVNREEEVNEGGDQHSVCWRNKQKTFHVTLGHHAFVINARPALSPELSLCMSTSAGCM